MWFHWLATLSQQVCPNVKYNWRSIHEISNIRRFSTFVQRTTALRRSMVRALSYHEVCGLESPWSVFPPLLTFSLLLFPLFSFSCSLGHLNAASNTSNCNHQSNFCLKSVVFMLIDSLSVIFLSDFINILTC